MSQKRTKKKCNYVALSPGEIKKMKDNGLDPHDYKDSGKEDLYKCKPSGKVVVAPKNARKGTEYQPIDVNIDDLPWNPKMSKAMKNKELVEFRVTNYTSGETVAKLPFKPTRSWCKGDVRHSKTTITHSSNGFAISLSGGDKSFEDRVSELLDKVEAVNSAIRKTCGSCQCALHYIAYLIGNERPVIALAPSIVHRLNKLKAGFDADIYFLGEDNEPKRSVA